MKQGIYTIGHNRPLTADVWEMTLLGDTSPITAPGQFINIKLEGLFLRRPISVCDWDGEKLTIIYKVVGKGTEQMSRMGAGEQLDVLAGLGNCAEQEEDEKPRKERQPQKKQAASRRKAG